MPWLNLGAVFWAWAVVGVIYVLRGTRQGETAAMIGGVALIICSFTILSWVNLTLVAVAIVVVIHTAIKFGW